MVCLCAIPASATILYVDSARSENGDGKSWATAFQAMEPALTAAENFDTLRIARGTYVPSAPPTIQSAGFTPEAWDDPPGGICHGWFDARILRCT